MSIGTIRKNKAETLVNNEALALLLSRNKLSKGINSFEKS